MDIFRPGGLSLTDKAAEFIQLKAGDRVLDIGCGFGSSLEYLRNRYSIEAFGLDLSPQAVQKATIRIGADRIQQGDACALPYEEACFDAVFMECVLTLTECPYAALCECWRVLKDAGYLIISSLDGASVLCDKGRIGRTALLDNLKKVGFEVCMVSDETTVLKQFLAQIIFEYDSMENYIDAANNELGGSVLHCEIPMKNTGYVLVVAKKTALQ